MKHDSSSEAIAYNKFSAGIYQKINLGSIETKERVGHAPVELSSLKLVSAIFYQIVIFTK